MDPRRSQEASVPSSLFGSPFLGAGGCFWGVSGPACYWEPVSVPRSPSSHDCYGLRTQNCHFLVMESIFQLSSLSPEKCSILFSYRDFSFSLACFFLGWCFC